MNLLEKYLAGRNEMREKIEEIHNACDEAIDEAGKEFLEKFKVMIANASEKEFSEFLCHSGDELDDIERMAALTARLEAYTKKCDENKTEAETEKEKDNGHHIVIIELD